MGYSVQLCDKWFHQFFTFSFVIDSFIFSRCKGRLSVLQLSQTAEGYIRAFCFSPAPEPRYFERASLNFHVKLSENVRRAGLRTESSR